MKNKGKILVTGGTGYIGSHTAVELTDQGFEVIIVDNLSNSEKFILDRIKEITGQFPKFYEYDLVEPAKVDQLFGDNPDLAGVIHFAAYKAVGESVEFPLRYYRNNLVSLVNLLESMARFKVSNMVFSSSCTVYGQPDLLPVTEAAPIKEAMSPYGNTKQICEEIIRDAMVPNQGLKAISLRYFNPIGAHDSALIGELPRGVPNNLVPFITQTAIGKREKLNVFGDDYNTPDGSCIRDYIHVVDLAQAHVVAMDRLIAGKNKKGYEIFNLGTGNGISVLEVVRTFEKVSGLKLNYKIKQRRPGDVEQIWADTTFANKELGWKAARDLDAMVLSAWNWEKSLKSQTAPS